MVTRSFKVDILGKPDLRFDKGIFKKSLAYQTLNLSGILDELSDKYEVKKSPFQPKIPADAGFAAGYISKPNIFKSQRQINVDEATDLSQYKGTESYQAGRDFFNRQIAGAGVFAITTIPIIYKIGEIVGSYLQ